MDDVQRVVLIVDDEPDLVLMCRVNLELDGYAVVWADDPHEAVALARVEPPDVVLLDIQLRGQDSGWSVLEALQADPVSREIPIVMLSAHTDRASQLRALLGGAAGYVVKPFSLRDLVERIGRVIREDAAVWRRHCAADLDRLRAEVPSTEAQVVAPEGVA